MTTYQVFEYCGVRPLRMSMGSGVWKFIRANLASFAIPGTCMKAPALVSALVACTIALPFTAAAGTSLPGFAETAETVVAESSSGA